MATYTVVTDSYISYNECFSAYGSGAESRRLDRAPGAPGTVTA